MSAAAAGLARAPGQLGANVVHFAGVLRASGIPIGTDKVIDAVRVLPISGLARRADWHATLAALFLTRREQQALFDEAFERFWRDPGIEDRMRALLLPKVEGRTPRDRAGGRLAEALFPGSEARARPREAPPEATIDATLTFSARERLSSVDFERMTAEEWALARRIVAGMRLPVPEVRTRRYAPSRRGRAVDLAATLRQMARRGGDLTHIPRREPRRRAPPLVVLCDISGSMHRYTRMFLHFLHALTRDRERVSTFLFGTRLTNVTRPLRDRDVDEALGRVSAAATDWAGGTRIGACLREFNFRWARRLLGQNACVLLVTDGLERDETGALEAEMARLHRSCRRLVWLNPLLRYAGFEPRASGIASMRPHVDAFLPVHDLESLRALAAALPR
ncbi:MAG TPA: VWA domain-containing protein [Usitatibacter sp.]|nr:VWA domain-containing protein [Usitatibacter sp.]